VQRAFSSVHSAQVAGRRQRRYKPINKEISVITAIVQFQLPADVDSAKAAELFAGSAPKYRALPGLLRKYYIYDKDTRTGGGCYLWESREAAEKFYDAEWRRFITGRYGSAPTLTYFKTPVIVDNITGETQRHA